MRYLRQNTAAIVAVGPFVDWGNGKSLLRDQADFTPSDITCELIKGSTGSQLSLTKTEGDNDIILTGYGQATLELTAANTDTLGHLRLSFADVLDGGFPTQTILSFVEDFMVMPANVFDSLFGSDNLQVDAAAIATAILNQSGFTAGGTMTVANMLKFLAAWFEGTWNLKTGTADTWQVSDAESKDVAVLEVQLKVSENPYKSTTRL